MRTEILNYITAQTLTGFRVSDELPWDNNGTPLYMSNMKTVYVDLDQIEQTKLIDTLNGPSGAVDEISTVSVYFVTDAKKLPSNYDTVVSAIRGARLATTITGVIERLCQVSTEFESDRAVTRFDFRFRKLIPNQ
jgi:hypothetical protein